MKAAAMNDEAGDPEDLTSLTDDELDEELTIAATADDDDPDRDERFEYLLEEHEHRSGQP